MKKDNGPLYAHGPKDAHGSQYASNFRAANRSAHVLLNPPFDHFPQNKNVRVKVVAAAACRAREVGGVDVSPTVSSVRHMTMP